MRTRKIKNLISWICAGVGLLIGSMLGARSGEVDCSIPEPKDVACRITWDYPSNGMRVDWYEVRCASGELAARIDARSKKGSWIPPINFWNPYKAPENCWPRVGQVEEFRVLACNQSGCSSGLPRITVIGTEISCCNQSGCVLCDDRGKRPGEV